MTAKPSWAFGVPFVPPPAVTTAGTHVRTLVARVHRMMGTPPLAILEGLFGLLDHRVLAMLVEMDVPDALDRRMRVDELAARVGADADGLRRVLRYAAVRGWVRLDRRDRVRPTRTLRFLRRDHPGGWRAWVEFASGPEVASAVASYLPQRVDAFAAVNGAPFFEWMSRHPQRWDAFNRAMEAGARMHGLTLDAAFDWSTVSSVCDVGGGTGQLLRVLLDRHPSMRGTVLDLPGVLEGLPAQDRLSFVAGDAFADVPGGFDVYLFVNVLHDWGDEDAGRLLSSVGRAMGESSRVIVVESDAATWRRNGVALSADVLIAALTAGGRERTAAEFAAIAEGAGLRLARTVRLASADVAHEFEKG